MVANSLISLRAAEIPGMLDRWHMKCLTISQPHNDTPPPFLLPGSANLLAGTPLQMGSFRLKEREREGDARGGGSLRPNHFLKTAALSRLLWGPKPLKESSRDWGVGMWRVWGGGGWEAGSKA